MEKISIDFINPLINHLLKVAVNEVASILNIFTVSASSASSLYRVLFMIKRCALERQGRSNTY